MDIKEIAEKINKKVADYQMTSFRQIKKKLHGDYSDTKSKNNITSFKLL